VTEIPCCTSDYFPTVCSALGIAASDGPQPIDGVNLLPLVEGQMAERPRPMAFESRQQVALLDNRYKIISTDGGKTFMLFDIVADPNETNDLAVQKPGVLETMRAQLEAWRASCTDSREGEDYGSA
jgi:arylsulfatase A-like enzyme